MFTLFKYSPSTGTCPARGARLGVRVVHVCAPISRTSDPLLGFGTRHCASFLEASLLNCWSLSSQTRNDEMLVTVESSPLTHCSCGATKRLSLGAPGRLHGWASAFGSGHDPGVLGWSPHQVPVRSLLLPLPMSLPLSLVNK